MPRVAVNNYNTSFFHIMVQGIRGEYIFNNNYYIDTYLKLIYKYMPIFKVKIIAYCIMNNHAHLLIYVNKTEDLSKFMHSINTTYALYYNKYEKRKGYVFRNRYKIEPIFNEIYLNNCINYIHDNPIHAKICDFPGDYKYSSYRRIYNEHRKDNKVK